MEISKCEVIRGAKASEARKSGKASEGKKGSNLISNSLATGCFYIEIISPDSLAAPADGKEKRNTLETLRGSGCRRLRGAVKGVVGKGSESSARGARLGGVSH
jgi:hypothetical protein